MDSFHPDSGRDETMQVFSLIPFDLPSSPSAYFNSHNQTRSNFNCDLPDNEDTMDLITYLDGPEDSVQDICPVQRDPALAELFSQDNQVPDLISLSDNLIHSWSPGISFDSLRPVKQETHEPEQPVFSDSDNLHSWSPAISIDGLRPVKQETHEPEQPVFSDSDNLHCWSPAIPIDGLGRVKQETSVHEQPVISGSDNLHSWSPLISIDGLRPVKQEINIPEQPVFSDKLLHSWSSEIPINSLVCVKQETAIPEQPVSSFWDAIIDPDEKYLTGFSFDLTNCCDSLDGPVPEIEINYATDEESEVDIESVEATINPSCSADMFDESIPSISTASTSHSTKAKNQVVYTARVISMPKRPVGRPRGSTKQSAKMEHASTSTSLPSCSKSKTENSTTSNSVSGRKRKLVQNDITKAQSQSTYTQVPSTSIQVNFHDYALNPAASPSATETARPTIVARRVYRRNTDTPIDKEKQNHHNQLERNRRQKLAELFTDLRDEVPNIASNPKASKVLILREARSHILDLQEKSTLQEDESSRLLQQQNVLKIQLQQLQSKLLDHVK